MKSAKKTDKQKRKSAENRMNTAFSALYIFNNYFTSDNKHYVKITDYILKNLNTRKSTLFAIMVARCYNIVNGIFKKGAAAMADKLVNLNYKISEQLKKDAETMAAIRGASLSEYVRNLIYSDCKKNADKIKEYRKMLQKMNE